MKVFADFIEYGSVEGLKDCFQIPDAFSPQELDKINGIADEIGLEKSYIRTESGKRILNPKFRTSDICWVPKEKPHLWIYRRMGEITNQANSEVWNFNISGMMERIQLTEYRAEENAHFNWHIDLGVGALSKRKISISVLLSDPNEYEGGDLEFFTGKKNYTAGRARGTAILFPSYLTHRITPVTRGTRRSMIVWISGPPFR